VTESIGRRDRKWRMDISKLSSINETECQHKQSEGFGGSAGEEWGVGDYTRMAQVQVSLRDSYLGKDLKMTVSHAKSLG
jgi:hypothetical protein